MLTSDQKRDLIHDAFVRAESFSGWGKFDIEVRTIGPMLPWSYDALAREAVSQSRATLDIATGGGERLLSIAEGLNGTRIVATEAWHINAPIAARALAPLGVAVVRSSAGEDGTLPFRDASVDLVLNRHGPIDVPEIDRVLQPGGRFLTQQVDPLDWPELMTYFPRITLRFDNSHEKRAAQFRALGYDVRSKRHDYRVAYATIADLAYNLAVAPWTIPDFEFSRDCDALLALDAQQFTTEGIEMTRALYLLSAAKPAG